MINESTTLLLPPYPPPVEGSIMEPAYENIQDIILELWDYCMELEDEWHETGDQGVLLRFAVAIMSVQYWEDALLNMEGYDVFGFYF